MLYNVFNREKNVFKKPVLYENQFIDINIIFFYTCNHIISTLKSRRGYCYEIW